MIIAAMLVALVGLVVMLVVFRRKAKRSGTAVLNANGGEDSLKELDNLMYSAAGNPPITSCMCDSHNCNHVLNISIQEHNNRLKVTFCCISISSCYIYNHTGTGYVSFFDINCQYVIINHVAYISQTADETNNYFVSYMFVNCHYAYTDTAVSNTQQPLLELYSTVGASDYETPVNTLNEQAALYVR